MAYLRNPVYLGVGAVDRVDRDAGIVRRAEFQDRFKNAFFSLMRMPPQARATFMREVMDAVSALPPEKRQQVEALTNMAVTTIDPRVVPGLGQLAAATTAANAVHWTTTVANIAGTLASVASVGIGVANFIQQRKATKEQAELQERQQRMQEQQMQADIAAQQARIDEAKAQTAALQEQAKRKQLEDSGYTVNPDGTVVPKAKNPALTIGAIGAAVVGAFLVSK